MSAVRSWKDESGLIRHGSILMIGNLVGAVCNAGFHMVVGRPQVLSNAEYGALVAMVQRDIKKLVAYSSVSHMGFVMLGLASFTVIGTQGAMLQMLNHGISTGALFLLVGMLYDRAHTRMIADFGGVVTKMPVFTTFFLIVTLSSIGLPLTNGFVGEFWILNGTFLSGGQRQRLAIARAVLRRAPILLLDEATSALDSHSETLVRDALDRVTAGVTTVVVAHRLSTVLRADRICYLEQGKVVETGSLAELLAMNGKFRALYDQQFAHG